ncbi:hypothetical protein HYH02_011897 [Chlamydomonas schloesseri]|uniref:Protein kinase domain-containing protein n=1 Tax=Chlamydomonas schloesseri TaxID=2026947 RepID=A0A835TCD1_9CHLO|nr:hypothetical protein HYH02_011897 [Chlamydomonas schloesseri]|eukprot:KAG2435606.1 hypothetical protein HYH02_011897 [Chlamydomonas schloesseri]
MESILGSAFECCLPLPDCGTLTGAEAARLVLDALNPAPGDFLVALVSELCLLGDLTSALGSGVFGAACCAASHVAKAKACALPSGAAAEAAEAAAAAAARGCSGAMPASAGVRRGNGSASGAAWTPAHAVRAAVATAREAALGVVHLHASGSAHGNLRPSNVQLLESHTDCRGFVAKVSDAGLGPRHTELGPELVAYVAPEALVWGMWPPSLADVQAADVYSFGVLLFEMLTGHRPSAQDLQVLGCATAATGPAGAAVSNPADAADATAAAQQCWPEGWDPSVLPAQLLQLCGWCLQPDADARPRMDTVASQLGHIEAHLRAAAAEAKQRAAARAAQPPVGGISRMPASAGTFEKPAAGGICGDGGGPLVALSAAGATPAAAVAATMEPLSVLAAVSRLVPAVPESCSLLAGEGRELALPLLAACGRNGGLHSAESLDWSAVVSEDWGT